MLLTKKNRATLRQFKLAGHSDASLAVTAVSMSIKNKRDAGVSPYRPTCEQVTQRLTALAKA